MIDTQSIRNKILDFAMQGKLSEQQIEDDSVEKLYADIIKSKEQILKDRKGRKDNNIKEIGEDTPFDIPAHWKWIRFGDVGLFKKGPFGSALTKSMFVPKDKTAIKVYEQQHAIKKDFSLGTYYITKEYFDEKMSGFEVQPGDIIVSCAGTIGETYILPENIEPGIINQALMRITLVDGIDKRFFLYYFDSNLKKNAQEESNGSAIKNIPPFDVMKNWYFPLAPVEEQGRIVDQLGCVFKKLDVIDALQQQYASNQEALKKKIIDAGISGALTEQFSKSETVDSLLAELEEGRTKLIQKGEIRKRKVLPILTEDEQPFEIPQHWEWMHVSDVWAIINGDRGKNYPAKSTLSHTGIPFISALNLDGETVVSDERLLCLSDEQYERLGSGKLKKGDVVVCIRGSLGKHGKYPFERGAIASSLIIARNYLQNEVINDYLMIYLDSQLFRDEIEKYNGGSAQPNLAAESLEKFRIPFPPLEEQKRIVKRVSELLKNISE